MELTYICQLFAAFTGLSAEEALEQTDLIRLAVDEVERSLKEGVDPQENRQVLGYAAAALAFYRYSVIAANTGGIKSLKTGDVTIGSDPKSAMEVAAVIRDEFLGLAAPLMTDQAFGFQTV